MNIGHNCYGKSMHTLNVVFMPDVTLGMPGSEEMRREMDNVAVNWQLPVQAVWRRAVQSMALCPSICLFSRIRIKANLVTFKARMARLPLKV